MKIFIKYNIHFFLYLIETKKFERVKIKHFKAFQLIKIIVK